MLIILLQFYSSSFSSSPSSSCSFLSLFLSRLLFLLSCSSLQPYDLSCLFLCVISSLSFSLCFFLSFFLCFFLCFFLSLFLSLSLFISLPLSSLSVCTFISSALALSLSLFLHSSYRQPHSVSLTSFAWEIASWRNRKCSVWRLVRENVRSHVVGHMSHDGSLQGHEHTEINSTLAES